MSSAGATVPHMDAVRLDQPGDVAALVPQLVGFVPAESLVVVSLRPPRGRVGLTARVDLDAPPQRLIPPLAQALRVDGAAHCLLVVFTAAKGRRPHARLVAAATSGLGVPVREALLVRDGLWSSYTCRAACCPPGGSPVPQESPVAGLIAAERVLDGRVLLSSREELVASVQPELPLGMGPAAAAQAGARRDLQARLTADPSRTAAQELDRWRAALDAWTARPGRLDTDGVPALALGLHEVAIRDEVASWAVRRGPDLLGLLLAVSRLTAPPDDAPVCAVLGWTAYAGGDGALALVAVLRALETDPAYSMASLLLQAVDAAAPPAVIRTALRSTARELRSRRSA